MSWVINILESPLNIEGVQAINCSKSKKPKGQVPESGSHQIKIIEVLMLGKVEGSWPVANSNRNVNMGTLVVQNNWNLGK